MASRKQLHILYIVQYFNLPEDPGGSRPYQFARCWVRQGHRVTVLTSNLNHKTLSRSRSADETVEGIRIVRLRTYNRIRGSYRRRFLNFLSFAALACLRGLTLPRFDLVYASSTPLTVGIPGSFLSLLRRKPFYFEVRDLWPESAVIAGALTNRHVITWAERLERLLYRRAARVIAVTEGIRAGVIQKRKRSEDVLFIPNGMDDWMIDLEVRKPDDFPFDSSKHFICTYIGAHGKWNRLETLLECAKYLEETKIRFLLIGDGDYKDQLEQYASKLKLTNVCFHAAVPKHEIMHYLSHSHVAVICTWDHPFQTMVLANKIFDYMAAARPILTAARGEMVNLIRKADCGWSVEPERPIELAQLIRKISGLPQEEIRRRGENGRNYALKNYLRTDLARRLEQEFLAGRSLSSSVRAATERDHETTLDHLGHIKS